MSTEPTDASSPEDPMREHAEAAAAAARAGKRGLAAAALEAAHEELPEAPLRFSLLLVRVAKPVAARLADTARSHGNLRLHLAAEGDDWLVMTADDEALGVLPAVDRDFLNAQTDPEIYAPRLLEISPGEDGAVRVAIELVRPEQRTCTLCEAVHGTPFLTCPECRRVKGRRGTEADAAERPPVPLAEALGEYIEARDPTLPRDLPAASDK